MDFLLSQIIYDPAKVIVATREYQVGITLPIINKYNEKKKKESHDRQGPQHNLWAHPFPNQASI